MVIKRELGAGANVLPVSRFSVSEQKAAPGFTPHG